MKPNQRPLVKVRTGLRPTMVARQNHFRSPSGLRQNTASLLHLPRINPAGRGDNYTATRAKHAMALPPLPTWGTSASLSALKPCFTAHVPYFTELPRPLDPFFRRFQTSKISGPQL